MPCTCIRAPIALVALTLTVCAAWASPRGVRAAPPAAKVIDLTNAERARAGRAPLTPDPRLMRAAQLHAEQMARLGRLDHVLDGASHPRPEDRLASVGYNWHAWAENVASGQESPSDVLRSWMRSKGHRSNILNATVTEVGAGSATDLRGRMYWVQLFARPVIKRQ